MKVALLARGLGLRLAEETQGRPKPTVEIRGRPILRQITMHHSRCNLNEFVIPPGYKGECLERCFAHHAELSGDLTVHMGGRDGAQVHTHEQPHRPWTVDLVETGAETLTGGRGKRLVSWLGGGPFMLTWGGEVPDVDLRTKRRAGGLAVLGRLSGPFARCGRQDA